MSCASANACARSAEREATATNSAFGTSGASPTTFDAMRPGPTTPQRTVMSPSWWINPTAAAQVSHTARQGAPDRLVRTKPPREGRRLSTNAHPARRRWRLVLVPVAAVGLAGLVACGTGAAASSSAGAPDDSAMAAFASCMAENGVTLPERGAPDGGTGGAGSAGGAAAGSGGAGAGSAGGAAAGPVALGALPGREPVGRVRPPARRRREGRARCPLLPAWTRRLGPPRRRPAPSTPRPRPPRSPRSPRAVHQRPVEGRQVPLAPSERLVQPLQRRVGDLAPAVVDDQGVPAVGELLQLGDRGRVRGTA